MTRGHRGSLLLRCRTFSGPFSKPAYPGAPQFIRNILGYSPLKAGVAFLPVTVTVTIGALAAISARLVGRVGPKLPMTVGPSLAAVGLFWLSFIQADTDCWKVLLPTLFIAMGRGTSFVPLTLTAVSGVRRDEAGLASALLNTSQQIGGSLGLAILVTVSTSATSTKLAHLLGSGSATAPSGTPGAAGGCRDRAARGDHFSGGDPGVPPGPARRGRAGPGLRRAPMRLW